MDKLVDAISEAVLLEVDDIIGEASGQPRGVVPEPVAEMVDEETGKTETVLWEGRPFLTLGVKYQITSERIRVVKGIMGKDREDIELVRVQDVDQTQSSTERLLNLGDIHISSHDPSSPQLALNNIAEPQEVHEILRRAVLEARERHRLIYREEM
jgi:hypothetical protein